MEGLQGAEINEAKALANAVTTLAHGADIAAEAEDLARRTFEDGALDHRLPTYDLGADDLASGLWVIDALRRADLAASNGEARRLIKVAACASTTPPSTTPISPLATTI